MGIDYNYNMIFTIHMDQMFVTTRWNWMLRTHFGQDSRSVDAQPHWLFRGRVSDDFASLYKTPLHSTYLWWSRSPAPGKSPSCSPDLAAASQSLDEWFCQSTTWWGRERKHGTHGTRLVRGEVGACGRKMREDESEGEFLVVSENSVKLLSLHSRCNAC